MSLQRTFDEYQKGEPDFSCYFLNDAGNPSAEWGDIEDMLENAPTVDAVQVKRGKWIDVDYKTLEHGFVETYPNDGVCCSECRTGFRKSRLLVRNFCPNCGSYNVD